MATATKPKKARKPRTPARKDSLMRRFESTVGDGLPAMLKHTGDPRAKRLLEMMLDPAYKKHSFAKLCQRAGIRMADLMDLFRRFKFDLAILEIFDQAPQVARELAHDAQGTRALCRRCDGLGYAPADEGMGLQVENRTCPVCEGTGKMHKPADRHARDLFFKMAGLLDRQAGVVTVRPRPKAHDVVAPMLLELERQTEAILEEWKHPTREENDPDAEG